MPEQNLVAVEKLVDQLFEIQAETFRLRFWLKNRHLDLSPLSDEHYAIYQHEYDELSVLEAAIIKRIYEIEGCEHANVEDTGGPDGSQVCMDCG
jgi:hypothetical protein